MCAQSMLFSVIIGEVIKNAEKIEHRVLENEWDSDNGINVHW